MARRNNIEKSINIPAIFLLIALCLFVSTIKSHSGASNHPWHNTSARSKRDTKHCVMKTKTGLNGWKPQPSRRNRHYQIPEFNNFNFSKLGCKRNDLECPCKNRNPKSVWPILGIEAIRGIEAVMGGMEAPKFGLPWMAFIFTDKGHGCAGVLVSYKFVITAARCVKDVGNLNVTLGAHDIDNRTQGIEISISREFIHIHPRHYDINKPHYFADIALIQLRHAVHEIRLTFHPFIVPACVSENYPDKNMACFGAGWGALSYSTHKYASKLRWIRFVAKGIEKGTIYATSAALDRPTGMCYDDEGSPLMCMDKGVTKVYGIFTDGNYCDNSKGAALYVSFKKFYPWVKRTMQAILKKQGNINWDSSTVHFERYRWDAISTLSTAYPRP